jgi:hypothetical protein
MIKDTSRIFLNGENIAEQLQINLDEEEDENNPMKFSSMISSLESLNHR